MEIKETKEKIIDALEGKKTFQVYFDDGTTKIIELDNDTDVDSYLHLLAKEQNKFIDEVFEIK